MDRAIEAVAAALTSFSRGEVLQPQRTVMAKEAPVGLLAFMPALTADGVFGAKVLSVFPQNAAPYASHQGVILLFDAQNGRLLTVMDAGVITEIRTAAASAVATRALAAPDASRLAVLGSGTQARAHVRALRQVRPIERVFVWSRTPRHAEAFRDWIEGEGLPATVCSTAREAVEEAEIVTTVTAATEPVLRGAWLRPGTHVNAVGSSVRPFRELDGESVRISRLFVDGTAAVLHENEDILAPIREGIIGEDHIRGEIGEVLAGTVSGRTAPGEITLFKSVGLAVEDMAAAALVHRTALATEGGVWVTLLGEREG